MKKTYPVKLKRMEYVRFNICRVLPKTYIFEVISNDSNIVIGYIKWFPAWRKYCFFPDVATIFCPKCLDKIASFTKKQNTIHKNKIAAGKKWITAIDNLVPKTKYKIDSNYSRDSILIHRSNCNLK